MKKRLLTKSDDEAATSGKGLKASETDAFKAALEKANARYPTALNQLSDTPGDDSDIS